MSDFCWSLFIYCCLCFILAVNGQEKTREDYVALNMVTSPQLQSDETKVKSVDEERLKVILSHVCHHLVINT